MSGAELALGIVGAVAALDVAIKSCKNMARRYSAFENAEAEIKERGTRLLTNLLQMGRQIEIFGQIQTRLDGHSQSVQINCFQTLAVKLNIATEELESVLRNSPSRGLLSKWGKAKYVTKKSTIDKAICEVETWQQLTFDPLWFETIKAQNLQFDTVLKSGQKDKMTTATLSVRDPLKTSASKGKSVFLSARELKSAQTVHIAYSSVKLIRINDKWRVLEEIQNLDENTVRELAVRLKSANPSTFGLLTSLGAVHHQPSPKFSVIFRMPDGMSTPETLRAKLWSNSATHSLSDTVRLATQLARAVFHIHTFDMVHKSVRPENAIVFRDSESKLGSAFLIGFENVRFDADATRLSSDDEWAKNIYRHPQRQGLKIQDRYIMQHDIYSLGVCLLEIGLWTSFVGFNSNQKPSRPKPDPIHGISDSVAQINDPEIIKSRLLQLAIEKLPAKMGTKYGKIVESCLTCLDLGNDDFGDEEELREEGVNVAVQYIEKVLMRLGEISV